MADAQPALLLDILEQHFEELEFLWGQRQAALRSPAYTSRALAELEERIEAHVQGLLVDGGQLLAVSGEALTGDDPLVCFAAAYPLLRRESAPLARAVMDAFLQNQGPGRAGLTDALCQAAPDSLLPDLKRALAAAPPIAVDAARILAFRAPGEITSAALHPLLKHEAPAVRAAAWRVVALGAGAPSSESWQAGLKDGQAEVRRESLWAAAWTGQRWPVDHCRALAATPSAENWEAVLLLAILGGPAELEIIRKTCRMPALGARRFEAAAAYGHPGLVELLLETMAGKDARAAVTAGAAFTRITGKPLVPAQRVQLPPEDGSTPDEVEKEFLDEAVLPSVEPARVFWEKVKSHFAQGARWRFGANLSGDAPEEVILQLDRAGLHQARLRGRMEGKWKGRLADLEVFPETTSS